MKTLVLGLGNPILTDDGVGVRVAEAVREELEHLRRTSDEVRRKLDSVEVREVSVGGLTLMEAMLGYDRVILIDALHRRDGQPGTVHRLTLDDLRAISPPQHTASAHDASLITALEVGQRMGLPLPTEIIIYAVEVENISDFSEELTPAVAQAAPQVKAAVLAEIANTSR
jgi:hydrogenase maturation protease